MPFGQRRGSAISSVLVFRRPRAAPVQHPRIAPVLRFILIWRQCASPSAPGMHWWMLALTVGLFALVATRVDLQPVVDQHFFFSTRDTALRQAERVIRACHERLSHDPARFLLVDDLLVVRLRQPASGRGQTTPSARLRRRPRDRNKSARPVRPAGPRSTCPAIPARSTSNGTAHPRLLSRESLRAVENRMQSLGHSPSTCWRACRAKFISSRSSRTEFERSVRGSPFRPRRDQSLKARPRA